MEKTSSSHFLLGKEKRRLKHTPNIPTVPGGSSKGLVCVFSISECCGDSAGFAGMGGVENTGKLMAAPALEGLRYSTQRPIQLGGFSQTKCQ